MKLNIKLKLSKRQKDKENSMSKKNMCMENKIDDINIYSKFS